MRVGLCAWWRKYVNLTAIQTTIILPMEAIVTITIAIGNRADVLRVFSVWYLVTED